MATDIHASSAKCLEGSTSGSSENVDSISPENPCTAKVSAINEHLLGVNEAKPQDHLLSSKRTTPSDQSRPPIFTSRRAEIGFVCSIVMSQVLTEYFSSGFNIILPAVAADLDIPTPKQTWPAAAFPLAVSCLLLPFGRLSDQYGGYLVYLSGTTLLAIFALLAGFSRNETMMDICRGLQGVGTAAFLPASMMLLGSNYRPGPRKNRVFAMYGAAAPLGFFTGILIAGLCVHFTSWTWYFHTGAILTVSTTMLALFLVPSDFQKRRSHGVRMDWIGCFLIPVTLIALIFAVTESASARQGWRAPHVLGPFILGVLLVGVLIYHQGWISQHPLLPRSIFSVRYVKPLLLSLLFSYGSLGVYMLYSTLYMQRVMGASALQTVLWFLPMALGGIVISVLGGFILHRVRGTILIAVASLAFVLAPLLFTIAPDEANYWRYIFPAMLCATIGIDVVFTVSNVFISTNVPVEHQGTAGAINNSLVHVAAALSLGLAGMVAASVQQRNDRWLFRVVFCFEIGLAATSLVVVLFFVRVGKAVTTKGMEARV